MAVRRGRAALAAALLAALSGPAALAQQSPEPAPAPAPAQVPIVPPPPVRPAPTGPDLPLTGGDPASAAPEASAAGGDAALPSQVLPTPGDADQVLAPVLTVDQDVLFQQSAWGRRLQDEFNQQGLALQAENDRLVRQLSDEEAALTEQRAIVDQAEFRKLAEAFDERATEIRRERAQAVTDLNASAEAGRTDFYRAALPVMGQMMLERGAVAVLDRRTVFVSVDAIDITEALITRIDAELGDGSDVVPEPPAGGPAPEAAPAASAESPTEAPTKGPTDAGAPAD